MIQKTYNCVLPGPTGYDYVLEYSVSAWMAMCSDTVNIRLRDGFGWFDYVPVQVEKLSAYAKHGVRTMDDLINHLFWVALS